MLDAVPFAGPRREVANADLETGLVGEALQLRFPEMGAVAVAAAAVSGDRQRARAGESLAAEVLPPAFDRRDRELGGVVIDTDVDPALVVSEIVDPVGDRFAEFLVGEIVSANELRRSFWGTIPARRS